ncbi:hypothetical protein HHUSO_G7022 [Huso huso]|uniref:Uncharacterized protein n=1 Tax=Huso huso TaxID=61971 RepID=A0ABR1A0A5_HUSHU
MYPAVMSNLLGNAILQQARLQCKSFQNNSRRAMKVLNMGHNCQSSFYGSGPNQSSGFSSSSETWFSKLRETRLLIRTPRNAGRRLI